MGVSLRLQEPPHHPGELVYSRKQSQEGEDLLKADVPVASPQRIMSVLLCLKVPTAGGQTAVQRSNELIQDQQACTPSAESGNFPVHPAPALHLHSLITQHGAYACEHTSNSTASAAILPPALMLSSNEWKRCGW